MENETGSSVLYEVSGAIARVTLNRPERRNPLSNRTSAELVEILGTARQDPSVRVVVLTGKGEAFSAGGDLKEFNHIAGLSGPEMHEYCRQGAELFLTLLRYPKPIVAAVNGYAYAGGCGLAAACPVVIASDRAKFGVTEVRVGLFPFLIFPALRAAVGDRKALLMALTGEILDARQAEQAGLVSRVVPHEQLPEAAERLAAQLAQASPLATRVGLMGFRETAHMDLERAMEHMATLRTIVQLGEDFKEGAAAFLEKRAPQFKGR